MPEYAEIDWLAAACRNDDPELYFSLEAERSLAAYKRIEVIRETCGGCPIVLECLAYAFMHTRDGFWGGMTATERHGFALRGRIYGRQMKRAIVALDSYGIDLEQLEQAYERSGDVRRLENSVTNR